MITMPPLREHPEDIPVITRFLIDRFQKQMGPREGPGINASERLPVEISAEALSCLTTRTWEGNVRELGHVLEQAVSQASLSVNKYTCIDIEHLNPDLALFRELPFKEAKTMVGNEWAKMTIRAALIATGGNVSKTAKALHMNRNVLTQMMKKFRIERQ